MINAWMGLIAYMVFAVLCITAVRAGVRRATRPKDHSREEWIRYMEEQFQ